MWLAKDTLRSFSVFKEAASNQSGGDTARCSPGCSAAIVLCAEGAGKLVAMHLWEQHNPLLTVCSGLQGSEQPGNISQDGGSRARGKLRKEEEETAHESGESGTNHLSALGTTH